MLFFDVIDRNIRIMETHTPQERQYAMARMKAMDALFCLCALIQRKQIELPMTKVTGFLITFRECLSPRRPPWFPRLVASDSLVWLSGFLYPHGAGFVRR
jgi:hypothetical protein